MAKILVTGGAGMIGSNLVKRLVDREHQVRVVDNLWRGKLRYLNDDDGVPVIDLDTEFFNRDLATASSGEDLIAWADYVYHLADIVAGIDYVFANQGDIFRQNMLINSNVIASARKYGGGLKGFIYVGTACSFPASMQQSHTPTPLVEADMYEGSPESGYGWSKLMGHYETSLMEQECSIPTSTLIFHNVYGSPCDFGLERSQVIPSLMRKAINYPEEGFTVWGSGRQGRAFVHVDDAVDALVLTMEHGLGDGIIQIGPSECTSIAEIAAAIVKISGKPIEVCFDTSRPEGDVARSADYSKAKRVLGWRPRVSLEAGVQQLHDWMQQEIVRDSL